MRCGTCGNWTGLFESQCKKCEKKRLDKWVKEHTFYFGEKVESLYNKEFYKERRIATIIDKRKEWGYHIAWTEYKIKFDTTGEELWQPAEELVRLNEEEKDE